MPGLEPGIHVPEQVSVVRSHRVDGRVKHGHDGFWGHHTISRTGPYSLRRRCSAPDAPSRLPEWSSGVAAPLPVSRPFAGI
ncbi:hypothetical protein CWS72_25660 [Telmatospirillum siberiense]|uniref:Uncharacterized protein n=1 Tax=Telmatospirillum siberiense TaxID=382514 RepID=A0A2N3PMM5_9PROT|nr:hypothetical protein CWS72_25660 [Telmatospirillum siberiense]